MGFRGRQLALLAVNANALRPLGGRLSIPAFFAGWFGTELTPQIMAVTALDAAQSGARGKLRVTDALLAGVNLALLGTITRQALQAGSLAESSLRESLGDDYAEGLELRAEAPLLWRRLARPFAMRRPDVEVIRDLQYAGKDMRGRLDIYRSKAAGSDRQRRRPVLLQVHGGAWMVGRKEEQGQLLMNEMASRDWVCVAVNYRLAPKHPWPAQIIDVKRALAWVRDNIADYGGDPDHIVITGGSAGGHLSSLAALSPNDPAYQPGFEDAETSVVACVPFYGVYDVAGATGDGAAIAMRDEFMAPRVFAKTFAGHEAEFRAGSPICRLDDLDPAQIPDFYALHGTLDSLVSVRQARAFIARLREVSPRTVTYTELPGAQHAFEVFGSIRSHQLITAVARWLEWHHQRGQAGLSRQPEDPLSDHVA